MAGALAINADPADPEWTITKSGVETIAWNKSNELSYTKVRYPGCTTKYTCQMRRGIDFYKMMSKLFADIDLQTYTGPGAPAPGMNNTSYDALNRTILSYNGYKILEFDPNLSPQLLIDYDDPKKSHCTEDACIVTYSSTPETKSGSGVGSQGEPDYEDDVIAVEGTPTGQTGASGYGQIDGDFEENDSQPFISQDTDKDDIYEVNSTLPNVVTKGHDIELRVINDLPTSYTLQTMDGKLIKNVVGFTTIETISDLAAGIYILTLSNGEKAASQKIIIH